MKFKFKKLAVLAATGLLTLSMVTGCSSNINTDAIVATVGDENITLGVANFFARFQQGQYESFYAGMMGMTPDTMWTQMLTGVENYETSVKATIMDQLQDMVLISQHAEAYGVELSEADQADIESAADGFLANNSEEIVEIVSGQRANIIQFLQWFTVSQRVSEAMRQGVDENVSDEEAAQKAIEFVFVPYANTDEAGEVTQKTEEEIQDTLDTARTLLTQVQENPDHDLSIFAAGFDVEVQDTTFDSESTSPNAELITAANELTEVGQLTDIIETENGLFVAKLTSLLDREATDVRIQEIISGRQQDQFTSLLDQWREETEMTVVTSQWGQISFARQGISFYQPAAEEHYEGDGHDHSTDDLTDEGDVYDETGDAE